MSRIKAHEVRKAGLRNKPQYVPTQYSVDWANVVCGYLKKQLTDIALPMAPRPGLNIKQSFKGVLSDQASRDRWVSRFTYRCATSFRRLILCINVFRGQFEFIARILR